jgi:SAM-dependent methyltransferase
LEHVANPLKAIEEWIRVIKKEGLLLLIVPNKDFCFDHNRSVTTFAHLLNDFQHNTQEDDLTHLDEIVALHDLTMDPPAGNIDQFRARSLKNFDNRALHQHVFDTSVLKEIFSYFRLEILLTHAGRDYTILGKKLFD